MVCFFSIGSGTGRAVICLEQNGEVSLELLPNGHGHQCLEEHLHGRQQHPTQAKNQFSSILRRSNCTTCDDFEVSFQLYAPRNEPVNTVINFIASPLFTAGIRLPQQGPANTFSPPFPPSTIDPSLVHLKSTILLI